MVTPATIEAESLIHSDRSQPRTRGLALISVEVDKVILTYEGWRNFTGSLGAAGPISEMLDSGRVKGFSKYDDYTKYFQNLSEMYIK